MEEYQIAAKDFIENEGQFHLGGIPTEQSNPITRGLSGKIKKNTADGVRMILEADCLIPEVSEKIFRSQEFRMLLTDIRRCMEEGHRIHFSSVGASGRMALQLDSFWRLFWQELIPKMPWRAQEFERLACCTNSFMTGGDRACVRSVENFEDYQSFGAQQTVDSGAEVGDVMVVLAECGLSSSTIGSAVKADDMGISTYYFYYNPKDILCRYLERARKVFAHERIKFIPMFAGNMAVAGSTRMQVTTIELLLAGVALEVSAMRYLRDHLSEDEMRAIGSGAFEPEEYSALFKQLSVQLMSGEALEGIAKAVDKEADVYQQKGLVTYCTHSYLQDILTDTTERQPTFTLPPFRSKDDTESPLSWAYAKDPLYPSYVAWSHVIRRPLKGIEWAKEDYIRLGASESIINNPPKIGDDALLKYDIGCEDDPSRYSQHPAGLMLVDVDGLSVKDDSVAWYERNKPRFDEGIVLRMGKIPDTQIQEGEIRVPIETPHTLMDIMTHVMVKLVFNALSTGTMAKMGRIWSNWMIQVLPTNKKLIDRSTRIIAELAHISYEQACEEFFKSYMGRSREEEYRESYVVESLRRLGVDPDQDV